jgi:hypothetical protein
MINCFTGSCPGSFISKSFKFLISIPAIALMAMKEKLLSIFLESELSRRIVS